ncbi:papain-like cysteine protease family protein [Massilia sp. W12]|uniref:papain-like cysteine protease family protein n=1 Tax=Massilia sp. W12 TaxID=3126507 RepID=UPI0030D57FB6
MKIRIEALSRTSARIGVILPPAAPQLVAQQQLQLELTPQLRSNWCWAAVACAVAAHYGDRSWDQCKLAWRILGDGHLPGPAPQVLLQAAQYDAKAELAYVLRYLNCLYGVSCGRPPFRRLMREIDAGRPLCVGIAWDGGGLHYVLLDGYCRNTRQIRILDPQHGASTLQFEDFPLRYRRGGEWAQTCWTQNPYLHLPPPKPGELQDEQL